MQKHRFSPKSIAVSGIISALYAVMSYFSSVFGIAYGPIQCRFAEALCVLPCLTPAAVPGLFLGCLVSNLLSPYGVLDVVFGSLATLLAALWTARLRRRWLTPLPPVLCNAVITGAVVTVQQATPELFWGAFAYNAMTIGLGEVLACGVLGSLLLRVLSNNPAIKQHLR